MDSSNRAKPLKKIENFDAFSFYNYDIETEIIVASIRHPIHVIESALIGADIATVPPRIIKKMVKHSLTDIGIENFLTDWKKVKK